MSASGFKSQSYSEILRVIGAYVERAHLRDVRIVEADQFMIVQGRVMQGDHAGEIETYQLTAEDIEALVLDARAQRGTRL